MRATIIATLMGLLGGCATCREHPVFCGVATAIVAGSIAAAVANENGHPRQAVDGCVAYYRRQGINLAMCP